MIIRAFGTFLCCHYFAISNHRKAAVHLAEFPAVYRPKPRFLITLSHLAVSDFIVAASCCGELPTGSAPAMGNRSFASGVLRNRTITWFSRLTIATGVLAGANMAFISAAS